jgi:hypothetical protein
VIASDWVDRRAMDNHGDLIGVVVDVYEDPSSHRPAWLAISTGFFGTRIAVVPLRDASLLGDDVVIGHSRHAITSAPHVDVVVTIEPSQQQALVEHYASSTPPRRPAPFPQPESST